MFASVHPGPSSAELSASGVAGGRWRIARASSTSAKDRWSRTPLSCDPPRSVAVTWEFADQVSWVRVHLSPDGDGHTVLELEHEAPVGDPTFWETYGPGAAGVGWDLGLLGLGLHLDGAGTPVDPAAAQAWTLSDEGVAFVRAAALDWAAAAIDDGDDGRADR